jgi:NADP-dependent 3-hydroxy acid dehydrogenase YdfG
MTPLPYRTALIIGAGPGISSSLARQLTAAGLRVALAARNVDKLARTRRRWQNCSSRWMPPWARRTW